MRQGRQIRQTAAKGDKCGELRLRAAKSGKCDKDELGQNRRHIKENGKSGREKLEGVPCRSSHFLFNLSPIYPRSFSILPQDHHDFIFISVFLEKGGNGESQAGQGFGGMSGGGGVIRLYFRCIGVIRRK